MHSSTEIQIQPELIEPHKNTWLSLMLLKACFAEEGSALEQSLLKQATHVHNPFVAEDWLAWIEQTAAAVQLRTSVMRLTLQDAAYLAEQHGTLITCMQGKLVALLGRRLMRYRVLTDFEQEHRLVRADFFTQNDDKGLLVFVLLEPVAPLQEATSDAHGNEHAGAHEMSPWQRLVALWGFDRKELFAVLVFAIVIGLFSLAVPVTVQALVTTVGFGTVLQPIFMLTVILFFAMTFVAVMRVLKIRVVEMIVERFFVRVAVDVGYRVTHAQISVFHQQHGPELVNRFFEVVTVQKAAAILLLDGLSLLIQTLAGMVLLAFYHPFLLAFDAVLLAVMVVVIFAPKKKGEETAIKESKAKYNVAAWLEELARHPAIFREQASRRFALERIDGHVRDYLSARRSHFKVLLRQIVSTYALEAVGVATLLGVGGMLVIARQLTLGQLVAAEIIVGAVLAGIAKFGKQLETYYDLVASMDKLGHLIDLPIEARSQDMLRSNPKQGIHLRFCDVGLTLGHSPVIQGLSLDLEPGAKCFLTGKNSAGKSLFVNIAYGLLYPTEGFVEMDGVDIRMLSLENFRSQVAIVRQDGIFEGSILENILMGRVSIPMSEVRNALQRVGIYEPLMSLPDGLSTQLVASGRPLSDSQIRRLLLARALVGAPRLLIVDEIIDAFPADVRSSLTQSILQACSRSTVIFVSHSEEISHLFDHHFEFVHMTMKRIPKAEAVGPMSSREPNSEVMP